ncbi:MAG: Glu/Leu/Phe/Val dehydrogenase dimerization domain-containing protein [Sphingomonadaceae bacterium]|nr:Glu/Leu/Phe/Val dehydrogenase dimerization domain-containing protein [Sphingomonadaceae bacterium]
MARSSHPAHDLHEGLHRFEDAATGLHGVIAIHSTALGPAAGGCRFWSYANPQMMMNDALRLAQGMSFKNAMAGLPLGGGKAVIQRPAGDFDRRRLFAAFGRAVQSLAGNYVTAEDVGTSVADMEAVRVETRFVAGLPPHGGRPGGDPSPWTALGVKLAIEAAMKWRHGRSLDGAVVAVQGLGSVGADLCRLLHTDGARLVVADVDAARVAQVAARYGARAIATDAIHAAPADVFAPCALGGELGERVVESLGSAIVCGAANNQLASLHDGRRLLDKGVTYCPDYVVNAGGIINVAAEYLGQNVAEVQAAVEAIPGRLQRILAHADRERSPAGSVADQMARQLIADAGRRSAA